MGEGLTEFGVDMAFGASMLVVGAEGADGIAPLVLVDGVAAAPSSSLPHAPKRDRATAALNPIRCRRRRPPCE